MIPGFESIWLLPILMYAETHYRFRYFFSYLKKSEPEILADAPHRIEPGKEIPLLILVKDANRYPAILHQMVVTLSQDGSTELQMLLLKQPIQFRTKWWWKVFTIPTQQLAGWISLDVKFDIESGGKRRCYHNDNYRTSSQQPLKVFLAESSLPRLRGLHFGDAHVHSYFTDDQVEYGAPPAASVVLSNSIGLSYFCITDHSYDLDDKIDDYLHNDPTLPKWKSLHKEVSLVNRRHRHHKVIIGEEVSCRNSRGNNVHLLLYGNQKYIPGSGDSAERWLHTRSELSIRDILQSQIDAVASAAHPGEDVPFLQRLLLRRGMWNDTDLALPGIKGIQFLNGDFENGFQKGKRKWIKRLLSGARIFALAGNDAHGNFNRFRQLALPFLLVAERGRQIFGKMRTGLFLEATGLSESSVLTALKRGRSIISDGPVGVIVVTNSAGESVSVGGCISGNSLGIHIRVESSQEFGAIREVKLFCGLLGRKREDLIYNSTNFHIFSFKHSLSFDIPQSGYLRLEVVTSSHNPHDKSPHFCLTNPIWFEVSCKKNKKPFRRRA